MQMCMLQMFSTEWNELNAFVRPEEYMQCILVWNTERKQNFVQK